MEKRTLKTRKGDITFPAYLPVTTFGSKYPLDNLIRPYLPRLSQAVMVSYFYAKQIDQELSLPMFVDSGGFAALFDNAEVKMSKGLGVIKIKNGETTETIDPRSVLEFQEKIADVAFTLDFPIPPKLDVKEANKRQKLTIRNALWALENRRRIDLPLYAVVQAWDAESARTCARAYRDCKFDGVAIGGLVPRIRDFELVKSIVTAVREELPSIPLHVFGIGKPDVVQNLYNLGVDSVDSSAYVKLAADGLSWGETATGNKSLAPTQRMKLALCNLASATNFTLPLATSRLRFK